MRVSLTPASIENDAFPDGTFSWRAELTVQLRIGERSTTERSALIDTASDFCVFPVSMVEELSLDLSKLKTAPMRAFGGMSSLYFAEAEMYVKGFGEWAIMAGFANYECLPVLGNIGFLSRFIVVFDQPHYQFEIKPASQDTE